MCSAKRAKDDSCDRSSSGLRIVLTDGRRQRCIGFDDAGKAGRPRSRGLNAFFLYMKDLRRNPARASEYASILTEFPDRKVTEALAEAWRRMSPEQQLPFHREAEAARFESSSVVTMRPSALKRAPDRGQMNCRAQKHESSTGLKNRHRDQGAARQMYPENLCDASTMASSALAVWHHSYDVSLHSTLGTMPRSSTLRPLEQRWPTDPLPRGEQSMSDVLHLRTYAERLQHGEHALAAAAAALTVPNLLSNSNSAPGKYDLETTPDRHCHLFSAEPPHWLSQFEWRHQTMNGASDAAHTTTAMRFVNDSMETRIHADELHTASIG